MSRNSDFRIHRIELAIRFVTWADSARMLTAKAIQDHFEVSRATSFRWLRAYKDARGIT